MELEIGDRVSINLPGMEDRSDGVIIGISYQSFPENPARWSYLVKHDISKVTYHKGNSATSVGNNSDKNDSWYYRADHLIKISSNKEKLFKIFN